MRKDRFRIYWTDSAVMDLEDVYHSLRLHISEVVEKKITKEIYVSPVKISFPEQFQTDEYRLDCRRIVVRNYKILYQFRDETIFIIRVFNTFQNPLKSMR